MSMKIEGGKAQGVIVEDDVYLDKNSTAVKDMPFLLSN
jgi:hypothetical protein